MASMLSQDWEENASKAIAAGDETLARRAISRKQEHEKVARALKDQLTAASESSQTLRRQVDAMKAKHAEAKRQLATLAARTKAAEARSKLKSATSDVQLQTDAFSKFDRMKEKVEMAEAEADALAELQRDDALGGADLDAELGFSDDDLSVDAELDELKKKLGK